MKVSSRAAAAVVVVMVVVMAVAGVNGAPQGSRNDLIQSQEAEIKSQFPPRAYNFGFAIADQVRGVRFSQEGRGDERGHVTGVYSYVRPDNVLVTVRYRADETGFHPTIKEEPAPQLATHASPAAATASHTIKLPYTPQIAVHVTGQELQKYKENAARWAQVEPRQQRQERKDEE